jgi:hypothetical protein
VRTVFVIAMMMEAVRSSETSVYYNEITRRSIPEVLSPSQQRMSRMQSIFKAKTQLANWKKLLDNLNVRGTFILYTIYYKLIHSFKGAYSPGWTFGLPFRGFLITHTIRHTVGLLWTSYQTVEEASTYTGQRNI